MPVRARGEGGRVTRLRFWVLWGRFGYWRCSDATRSFFARRGGRWTQDRLRLNVPYANRTMVRLHAPVAEIAPRGLKTSGLPGRKYQAAKTRSYEAVAEKHRHTLTATDRDVADWDVRPDRIHARLDVEGSP